jgi:Tfp pilus assembly protein PilF
MSLRRNTILTHTASVLVGAIVGATLMHWMSVWIRHAEAKISVPVASQALQDGNEDKAIAILNQAIAEDPNYYEPFNFLGGIYLHRKNPALALEMYKKALDVFGREKVLSSEEEKQNEQASIQKKIDTLQNQLSVQHGVAQQK